MTTFPDRRPTMKEVARVADVSLATVSRVINGTGEVRPELAGRVHDAVNTLGYRRDVTASTLRRADRQSATIGLIIGHVANPFFSAVHRGVEDIARTECSPSSAPPTRTSSANALSPRPSPRAASMDS